MQETESNEVMLGKGGATQSSGHPSSPTTALLHSLLHSTILQVGSFVAVSESKEFQMKEKTRSLYVL